MSALIHLFIGLLFLGSLSSQASFPVLEGIGSEFYFGDSAEIAVGRALLQARDELGSRVHFFTKDKTGKENHQLSPKSDVTVENLKQLSCKILVWVPTNSDLGIQVEKSHEDNRVMCELDFDRYSTSQISVSLYDEKVTKLNDTGDPSFELRGVFSKTLYQSLKALSLSGSFSDESSSFRVNFNDNFHRPLVISGFSSTVADGQIIYNIFDDESLFDPNISCGKDKQGEWCRITLKTVDAPKKEFQIGANSGVLIKALCHEPALVLKSICSNLPAKPVMEMCWIESLWPAYRTSKVIEEEAKLVCTYEDKNFPNIELGFSIKLGTIMVSPWGNNLSHGVSIYGGMTPLFYSAMSAYKKANPEETAIDEISLGGRGSFGSSQVSLKRFQGESLVASIDCSIAKWDSTPWKAVPTKGLPVVKDITDHVGCTLF